MDTDGFLDSSRNVNFEISTPGGDPNGIYTDFSSSSNWAPGGVKNATITVASVANLTDSTRTYSFNAYDHSTYPTTKTWLGGASWSPRVWFHVYAGIDPWKSCTGSPPTGYNGGTACLSNPQASCQDFVDIPSAGGLCGKDVTVASDIYSPVIKTTKDQANSSLVPTDYWLTGAAAPMPGIMLSDHLAESFGKGWEYECGSTGVPCGSATIPSGSPGQIGLSNVLWRWGQ
jgi:hypothetical protein